MEFFACGKDSRGGKAPVGHGRQWSMGQLGFDRLEREHVRKIELDAESKRPTHYRSPWNTCYAQAKTLWPAGNVYSGGWSQMKTGTLRCTLISMFSSATPFVLDAWWVDHPNPFLWAWHVEGIQIPINQPSVDGPWLMVLSWSTVTFDTKGVIQHKPL